MKTKKPGKKMIYIMIGCAVLIILLVAARMFFLVPSVKAPQSEGNSLMKQENLQLAENQLIAMVVTEEEALELADLYQITFVELQEGVATFHTDEQPQTVIKRGEDNGYQPIYLNYINTIQ